MSMPSTSFLDEIENLFERLLTGFESAIAQPVIILERYSIRMYRFLRHMALKILRLVWLVFTLTFYVLAPFFVASFGDELRQRGIETGVQVVGVLVMLIGMAGIAVLGFGLIVYLTALFRGSLSRPCS